MVHLSLLLGELVSPAFLSLALSSVLSSSFCDTKVDLFCDLSTIKGDYRRMIDLEYYPQNVIFMEFSRIWNVGKVRFRTYSEYWNPNSFAKVFSFLEP